MQLSCVNRLNWRAFHLTKENVTSEVSGMKPVHALLSNTNSSKLDTMYRESLRDVMVFNNDELSYGC